MKKIIYTMLVMLMTAFSFTSCEDVPAPYDVPSSGEGGGSGTEEVAEGDGSLESPYNAAGVTAYIKTLESNVNSDNYVYIKGIVSSTKEISAQYGNASFYISADGTTNGTQFYVYRVKGLGNKNIASDDEVKVGDEVIVYAKVVNYGGNTPETVQGEGYIYSLNGKTEGGTTPSTGVAEGDGSKENPFNSVAAAAAASKLAADTESEQEYYIKGIVSSVKQAYAADQYGNASFYISADGTSANEFYCFHTLYLGNEKYTEGKTNIAVGDEVVVYGKIINYKGNTPETVGNKAYLVSLKSNGGGSTGGETAGDVEYLASNCGLANGTELTTLTIADGFTVTFDAGGNSIAPKFYTSGNNFRIYPKNTLEFKAGKNVESVTLVCDTYQGTLCNASGDVSATSGKVSTEGSNVIVSGIAAKEFTITNTSTTTGAASQLRITKIIVNYSK